MKVVLLKDNQKRRILEEISGSHGEEYGEGCLLECCAV
jgi:hypothetical protein